MSCHVDCQFRADHYPLGQPKGHTVDQSETAKQNNQ